MKWKTQIRTLKCYYGYYRQRLTWKSFWQKIKSFCSGIINLIISPSFWLHIILWILVITGIIAIYDEFIIIGYHHLTPLSIAKVLMEYPGYFAILGLLITAIGYFNNKSESYLHQIQNLFSDALINITAEDNNQIKWHLGIDSLRQGHRLAKLLTAKNHKKAFINLYKNVDLNLDFILNNITDTKFYLGIETDSEKMIGDLLPGIVPSNIFHSIEHSLSNHQRTCHKMLIKIFLSTH